MRTKHYHAAVSASQRRRALLYWKMLGEQDGSEQEALEGDSRDANAGTGEDIRESRNVAEGNISALRLHSS